MILLLLLFGGIAGFEWNYLTKRKRMRRTFIIVYSLMGGAFLYLVFLYYVQT